MSRYVPWLLAYLTSFSYANGVVFSASVFGGKRIDAGRIDCYR
jgi:hypothetical protein